MKDRLDFVSNSSSSSFVISLEKPIDEYSESEFIRLFASGRGLSNLYKKLKRENAHEKEIYITVGNGDEDLPDVERQLTLEYNETKYGYGGVVISYENNH